MSDQQQTAVPQVPGPPLLINTQYVKELSFRVPGAPTIYASMPERPHVVLALDVLVRPLPEAQPQPVFEVTLTVKCEATVTAPPERAAQHAAQNAAEGAIPPAVAYQLELGYAGIFTLAHVPQDAIEPVLLAECPRLLFPFARRLLADITREAGFAPLWLQPIDFIAFWQSKRQRNPSELQPPATGDVVA